jgi:GTP cyclohydrolase II
MRLITSHDRHLAAVTGHGLEVVERLTASVDAHHVGVESMLGARKTAQLKKLLETFLEADTDSN